MIIALQSSGLQNVYIRQLEKVEKKETKRQIEKQIYLYK